MDFSSIDRLVEFGLGIGVAQQMINTMNHAITNTAVPGTPGTMMKSNQTPLVAYYAIVDGAQAGPLSTDELKRLITLGHVWSRTLMWRQGLGGWMHASDIPDVNKLLLLCR